MFKNYLKIAVRNLFKNKFYSFLNLFGLAVGIAAGILIILYIQDELSFDKFHPNAENKYVLGFSGKTENREILGIFTPPPLAAVAVDEIIGIKSSTRTDDLPNTVFRHENKAYTESIVFYADSNFYDFFGYELLNGDPQTALTGPNKAVITESIAQKYFGSQDPIGKTLIVGNDKTSFEVTGVNRNTPPNSHFRFNILLSFSTSDYSRSTQWLSNNINTYLELESGTDLTQVKDGLDDLTAKYAGPQIQQLMGITLEQIREQGGKYGYFAISILDLHLNTPNIQTSFEPPGDITYVYIFSAIGIFLIVIACVNFMNLSTASAAGRAKEVGLRKTLGSDRKTMMVQFLVESILYVILATLISFVLMYLALPWFNQLSGKELTLEIFTQGWFLLSLGGLVLVIGLLAGSYPAFYLTAFNPLEVLKGKISRGAKSGSFRRTLVVGQFFISIALIACTILVNQQLQFMQNKNLGINKEQSIVLTNTSRLGTNRVPFKEALISDTRVAAASYSNFTVPGANSVTVFQPTDRSRDFILALYSADHDQQEALSFEMAEGRYFQQDFGTDTAGIVINEAAVQEMSLEEPVGKEIYYPANQRNYKILGVMKNFNFESLRNEIKPLAITLIDTRTGNANEMIVRFDSDDSREAVDIVESAWDKYSGGEPLDYSFLDQDFEHLFQQEQRLGQVFTAFTIIAIFIACLGLLGLSAYMTEQRQQEIGIRKVLGASITQIMGLMSIEFLKLTGIAFLLAVPVAWYFIGNWLQNFAYRIEVSPVIFVLTALVTAIIVLLTIGWQTMKAAFMNPVKSIGKE